MTAEIPIEAQRIIDTHKFTVATAGKAFVVRDAANKKLGRFEGPELLPLLHQAVAAKTAQPSALNDYQQTASAVQDKPNKLDTVPVAKAKKSYIKETDGPCFRVIFQGRSTSPTFKTKGPAKVYLQQLEAGRAPEYEAPIDLAKARKMHPVALAAAASPPPNPEPEPDTDPEVDEDEFEAEELDDTGGKTAKSRTPTVKKTMLEWTTGKVGILILKHADKSDAELYTICQKKGIKTKLLTIKGLRRYFKLCIQCQIALAEEKADKPSPVFTDEEKADMAYQSKTAG